MSQFLSFEDVDGHVSWLPAFVLERLAFGPLEESGGEESPPCQVCDVLGPLLEAERQVGVSGRVLFHARELFAWHEVRVEDLGEFADRADPGQGLGETFDLSDRELERRVFAEVMGAATYARCCVIYSVAARYWALRR